MALTNPLKLISKKAKKRDFITALDLGTRMSKSVQAQRKGDQLQLVGFSIIDSPPFEKGFNLDEFVEHLGKVSESYEGKLKQLAVVLGVDDSIAKVAEMPAMPAKDMRAMLKFNTKAYLQQDLKGHLFDCHILPPESEGEAPKAGQKVKAWVGGAKKELIDGLVEGCKKANISLEMIIPNLVCTPNAFEANHPDAYRKETFALVDFGYKNSSINILNNGRIKLNRVVNIGARQITQELADAMSISYAEAEGIKIGMSEEVEGMLVPLLSPLGRELRASVDYFEHQNDKTVEHVYFSGGSARSGFFIQTLQTELMIPCQGWNPVEFMTLTLPPQQMSEVESLAPQLTNAVGAAVAALH